MDIPFMKAKKETVVFVVTVSGLALQNVCNQNDVSSVRENIRGEGKAKLGVGAGEMMDSFTLQPRGSFPLRSSSRFAAICKAEGEGIGMKLNMWDVLNGIVPIASKGTTKVAVVTGLQWSDTACEETVFRMGSMGIIFGIFTPGHLYHLYLMDHLQFMVTLMLHLITTDRCQWITVHQDLAEWTNERMRGLWMIF